MYSNYKIICCTAAGRMGYMQYIIPYVITSDIVDQYDIWVNTTNMEDIECFRMLAQKYPKINLIYQPEGVVSGISSINSFYRFCTDKNSIYIKIDDDIVWMQPDIFEQMVEFRVAHRDAFLVSPQVVNNSISSYLWQVKGLLNFGEYMRSSSGHRIMWKRGAFALELHKYFLDKMEHDANAYKALKIGAIPVAANRFSINFILWFGEDLAKFNGEIPGDDEEFLSSVAAPRLNKGNMFNGDAIVAHFAFGPQRIVLDNSNILQRYGKVCQELFSKDSRMNEVWMQVQKYMQYIKTHRNEINKMECPLKQGSKKSTYKQVKDFIKKKQKLYTQKLEKLSGVKYIVQDGDIFKK